MTWNTANVFLNGPYATWQEEGDATDLEVSGAIPPDLNGTLYRIASSPKYRPNFPERYHWFDGDGMVHAFELRDGRANYRNRYVGTQGLAMEREAHRSLFDSLMNGGAPKEPPPAGMPMPAPAHSGSPFKNAGSPFKNPGNTNVAVFDGRLLVFSEAGLPHELDIKTMQTIGMYDFHGGVRGPVTAHWKVDPDNGDLLFYGALGSALTWYRANSRGQILDSHAFDIGLPCLMHDFLVTPEYAIFLISPTVGDIQNVFAGTPLLMWDPALVNGRSKFAVLNRATHALKLYDTGDPFGVTHYSNAFQRPGKLILDGHRVDRFGIARADLADYPGKNSYNEWFTSMYATPWRWEIYLAGGRVTSQATSDVQGEFPRINDGYAGKENRFSYYATTRRKNEWFTDGLAKLDYQTGRTQVTDFGRALLAPSEPTFVPRESARSEDDGWLLTYWWDPARDASELVIHDALDLTRAPVARVRLHHRVPLGFHGNWAAQ